MTQNLLHWARFFFWSAIMSSHTSIKLEQFSCDLDKNAEKFPQFMMNWSDYVFSTEHGAPLEIMISELLMMTPLC